jgi:hypothetical protein
MELTPKGKEYYIENNGNHCPYCDSSDLAAGSFETDESSCWRPVECKTCGRKWDEIYILSSIEPCM